MAWTTTTVVATVSEQVPEWRCEGGGGGWDLGVVVWKCEGRDGRDEGGGGGSVGAEFINLVSSESNEVCSREDKRTIAPEHVLKALEVLGFGDYIEDVYAAYEQHKVETADTVKGGKCTNGAEMTEEEALAEQQRMFAEARARMNGVATTTATAPKPPDAEPSLNC
ncbi:putative transcription factor Hap3/NF-YB family [Helianthus debilis subsp. tardiflorus]